VARRTTIAAVAIEPEVVEPGPFIAETVHVTGRNGLAISFRVLRRAEPVRHLPVVLLLGGHETGRDAVSVIGDPGEIVVVALDYPYRGPKRLKGIVASVRAVPAIQRALLDTPPAVSLALDWLSQQPYVDPERAELVGISLGVPFAAVAGALDARFQRVWLVHGGADNRAWLANRLESRIRNAALRRTAASFLLFLAYGESFQTDKWIRRISPRGVVVVGAARDEEMPVASVERLYAAAGEPKELLWTDGGHIRPDRMEIVRQLLDFARSRIRAPGEPEPRRESVPPGSVSQLDAAENAVP
jgi:hypothetical protein